MLNANYGLNKGQNEVDVTYSATTLTTDIQVVVNLTNDSEKADILIALEKISNYILKDDDHIFG